MLSAGSGGESDGAGLLFAYGLGIGLPFILVAVFADLFMEKFRLFSAQMRYVKWMTWRVFGGYRTGRNDWNIITSRFLVTAQCIIFSRGRVMAVAIRFLVLCFSIILGFIGPKSRW
jgi:thiol:disulfide interchange protein